MKNPFSASMSGFRPLTWNEGVRAVVRWNGGANPGEAERFGQAMGEVQWASPDNLNDVPGFGGNPTADPTYNHPIVSWYYPGGHPGAGWVRHDNSYISWEEGGTYYQYDTPQDGMGSTHSQSSWDQAQPGGD